MFNKVFRFIIVLTSVVMASQFVTAQSIPWKSTWENQRGSTLHIEKIDSDGLISGYYINRAQGYGCQNTPYPLTGWVLGNVVTFTVKWENTIESCKSLTAWTGFYSQGKITTLWYLVVDGTTSSAKIYKGDDVFCKITQKVSKNVQKNKTK